MQVTEYQLKRLMAHALREIAPDLIKAEVERQLSAGDLVNMVEHAVINLLDRETEEAIRRRVDALVSERLRVSVELVDPS